VVPSRIVDLRLFWLEVSLTVGRCWRPAYGRSFLQSSKCKFLYECRWILSKQWTDMFAIAFRDHEIQEQRSQAICGIWAANRF
jgi:hypothetical protein